MFEDRFKYILKYSNSEFVKASFKMVFVIQHVFYVVLFQYFKFVVVGSLFTATST